MWVERVSKLSAEEQVAEFKTEMQRRNPEWDAVMTQHIENGHVVLIKFDSLHVKDISPVVAFTNLKTLWADSSRINNNLNDLSPLAQLRSLTSVSLNECQMIEDLSPLADYRSSNCRFPVPRSRIYPHSPESPFIF